MPEPPGSILSCSGIVSWSLLSAIAQAISKGDKSFEAIVIYSPDYDTYLPPCGACRQVISEFSSTLLVIMLSKDFKYKMTTIDKLLPEDSLSNFKDQDN